MPKMPCFHHGGRIGVLLLLFSLQVVIGHAEQQLDQPIFSNEEANHGCDIYLAPSSIGGWGVFAARDFQQGEVVEVAPRYVTLKNEEMATNALSDFHYRFTFQRDRLDESFGATIFGMTMFYNHGPGEKHNVVYTSFGAEPDKDAPWASMLLGFVAKRKIQRGEELLSSYGETDQWFTERGLTMATTTTQHDIIMPSLEQLEYNEKQYCRKTYAGVGQATWIHRVLPAGQDFGYNEPYIKLQDMLPLKDYPAAIAKEAVRAGDILEIAPAIVVPHDHMIISPLAPMSIFWYDLDDSQKETIMQLRESGIFRLKAISNTTGRMAYDVLAFYDDAAILPAAGNIGLVHKVGRDTNADSNCRIEIVAAAQSKDSMDIGSSSLVLKLIATKDILPGQELRLNLPDHSSWHAKMNLAQHLAITGQPIPKHLVDTYNPSVMPEPPAPAQVVDQEL